MDMMARATQIVGAAMVALRRRNAPREPAIGTAPQIPGAREQGIMTLKMPTARGWVEGEVPQAAEGLRVHAFARDLRHPRWVEVLPNGDVLVAESQQEEDPPRSLLDRAAQATMRRAGALGKSANRVSLLRDADDVEVPAVRDARDMPLGDCPVCLAPNSWDAEETDDAEDAHLLGGASARGTWWPWARRRPARSNVMVTPCKHIFHTACLEPWMHIRHVCPSCRLPLPPYEEGERRG